jgi:soluble lytic murein transglycosylase-like protein
MMPSAALQQKAPHLVPLINLLATLPARSSPLVVTPDEPAEGAPARSNQEARRLTMLTATLRNIWLGAAGRTYAAVRAVLALIGLAALCGLLLPQQRESLLANLAMVGEPFGELSTVAAGPIQASAGETPFEREQRAVTEFIAKRYRVSDAAVAGFVSAAYRAGSQHSVDPLLILAVMAVESRYNPVAESTMGAKGLMQVIPKFHPEKLMDHGGEHALLEPEVNIAVGAQILREYMRRLGDTEAALQMYAGAYDEPTSQYANKVFAEKARLEVFRVKARKQSARSA